MTSTRVDRTPAEPAVIAPHVGQIVLYRSRAGFDLAAIITGFAPGSTTAVHLQTFPPPGIAGDRPDYEWGTAPAVSGEQPAPSTWRPLEAA